MTVTSDSGSAAEYTEEQTNSSDSVSDSQKNSVGVITDITNTVAVSGFGGSDTKFYHDKIITSKDGVATLLDLSGNVLKTYDTVTASWLYALEDSNCIVYGNISNQIGIMWLNDDDDLEENQIVFQGEHFQIDPTLIKTENGYLMTVTEVIGTANSSVESDNGEYILHLYSSPDLRTWTPVTDIADEMHNVEDVDLLENNGILYVIYEVETVDKGNSGIYTKTSSDGGMTWSNPVELLQPDSDHEPASFMPNDDGFILYYSSDMENPGTSYGGAKAYYATFDSDLNCIEKDNTINTDTEKGLLWYDVADINGQPMTLMAGDYITDVSLLISQAN